LLSSSRAWEKCRQQYSCPALHHESQRKQGLQKCRESYYYFFWAPVNGRAIQQIALHKILREKSHFNASQRERFAAGRIFLTPVRAPLKDLNNHLLQPAAYNSLGKRVQWVPGVKKGWAEGGWEERAVESIR